MRSSNPVLTRPGAFSRGAAPSAAELAGMYGTAAVPPYAAQRAMTVDDVVVRTALALGTVVVVGAAAWWMNLSVGAAVLAAIAGFVLAMVISFKRVTSPALVLAYAVCEGLTLGVISHAYNGFSHGVVTQAVIGTVLAFVAMLAAYATRIIRVTSRFTRVLVGALGGLFLLMVMNMLVSIFHPGGIGIRTDSPLGWAFSIVAIVVAALFLVLDFAEIERAVQAGVPEREAWLAAFGLTVTLVWLYLEMLRFLARLNRSST